MRSKKGDSLKFWKQFLLFAGPSLAALSLVFGIFYGIQRTGFTEVLQKSDNINIDFTKTILNNHFVGTGEDLLYLADIYNRAPEQSDHWYRSEQATRAFVEFLGSKSRYSHITILNTKGLPLIQLNNEGDGVTATPNPTLNLAEIEFLSLLKKQDVYISPMDLRADTNGIMLPKQPTISLITPLTNSSHDAVGFIELGMRAQTVINDFRQLSGRVGNHLYLINDNGYWLIHPNVSKEFGFTSTSGPRFSKEYPEEWRQMQATSTGQLTTDKGLFSFTTMTPTQVVSNAINHYSWTILALTSHDTIFSGLRSMALQLFNVYLGLVVVLAFICSRLAKDRLYRMSVRANLAENEQLHRSVVENSTNAIVSMNSRGIILHCNPATLSLFLRSESDVLGNRFDLAFIASSQQEAFVDLLNATRELPAGSHSDPKDFEGFDIHGYIIPITLTIAVDQWKGDTLLTAFITDNREHLKTLELQRLTEVVFRATTEGITITDANNNIEAVNPGFTTITGYTEAEVLNKNPRLLRSGRHDTAFYKKMWQVLHRDGIWKGEMWNRKKSGEIYPEELSIALVRDDEGKVKHHVAIFHDITTRKHQEQKISYQAHYDQLTNLPNRYVFMDHLDREIHNFKRYGVGFALLFIDLNRFKDINDSYGHRTGDVVLQEAAKRLKDSVRESDMVARLAGDEFTVVVRSVHQQQDLERLIAKIRAGLDGPLTVGEHQVQLSGAIGGVIYTLELGTADDLLNAADEAMYETKRHDELHSLNSPTPTAPEEQA